jgi:hypothetical protein
MSTTPTMVRTQIYLTEKERQELHRLTRTTGKSQAALIREAVDTLIESNQDEQRTIILRETAGLWKDRRDIPDFRALRSSWDRKKTNV